VSVPETDSRVTPFLCFSKVPVNYYSLYSIPFILLLTPSCSRSAAVMPIIDVTKDLAALFVTQAKATPDAIALEDESRSLTYAKLDQETETMADYLRTHYHVGRDSLVGILMSRSADYVVAALAALRAGGAFLVLELAYPSGLLRDVINDAKPAVVLTQQAHAKHIKSDVAIVVVDTPGGYATSNGQSNGIPLPQLPSDDDLLLLWYDRSAQRHREPSSSGCALVRLAIPVVGSHAQGQGGMQRVFRLGDIEAVVERSNSLCHSR
jgi:non-ribosomal peptide synthetase component F